MRNRGWERPKLKKKLSLSTYVANLIKNSTEVALGTAKDGLAYRKV
jgi:hypothetical protein